MKITTKWLKKQKACKKQIALFQATFPRGGEVTKARLLKAAQVGLNLEWLEQFIPAEKQAEYEKIKTSARTEYDKVMAPAWAEYNKVRASALTKYDKVMAPALAEYEKITASAWAKYDKVMAPAWAEYNKVRAPARAEYDKVRAPALAIALS